MESSGTISFRAYLSPRPGNRLLVTVLSPLLTSPLYRSYPADMGADAAVERAVGHAAAIVTALAGPTRVRVTWQAFLPLKSEQPLFAVDADKQTATA